MTTRSTIRSKVRQRADIESDTVRFPDSELNQYINDSLKKLQAHLLKRNMLMDEAMHEFTGDGSSNYALPSDYLATIGVWRKEGEHVYRLSRHRNSDQPFAQTLYKGTARFYRMARFNGVKSLELLPRSNSGTYLHAYVPVVTLDADTDELDDLLSWDEFIVLDAAIKCRMKDDIEVRDYIFERQNELARIESDAEALDLNEGHIMNTHRETVNDVYLDIDFEDEYIY